LVAAVTLIVCLSTSNIGHHQVGVISLFGSTLVMTPGFYPGLAPWMMKYSTTYQVIKQAHDKEGKNGDHYRAHTTTLVRLNQASLSKYRVEPDVAPILEA